MEGIDSIGGEWREYIEKINTPNKNSLNCGVSTTANNCKTIEEIVHLLTGFLLAIPFSTENFN